MDDDDDDDDDDGGGGGGGDDDVLVCIRNEQNGYLPSSNAEQVKRIKGVPAFPQ
jgi:hypothetical protein